jgi:hypothetical protein
MPDTRSDAELLDDAKRYGICTFCGTPRMTNQDGRARAKKDALICPNNACPAMQAITVSPPA